MRQHFFRSAKAVSRFSRSPIDLTIAGRSTYLGSRVSRSDCDDNGGYERTSGSASRGYRDYRGQDPDWWHVFRLLRMPDRENDPGWPLRDIGSGQPRGRRSEGQTSKFKSLMNISLPDLSLKYSYMNNTN